MRLISGVAVASLLFGPVAFGPSPAAAGTGGSTFDNWTSTAEFSSGTLRQAKVTSGTVTATKGTVGSWTSPWAKTNRNGRTLVPSWNVVTPQGTYITVKVRVRSGSTTGSWDTVARYATGTDRIKRYSLGAQSDDLARLNVDTITANSGKVFDSWQIRVYLHRDPDRGVSPTLRAVGGILASYSTRSAAVSKTTMTKTTELAVPRSSQMIHRNHYRQYDGGGAAWCSPTSQSMVLRYYQTGPSASSYAYTGESHGFVDYAARATYDYAYTGTGNWSFNTAYANRFGLASIVTRLASLREAEYLIRSKIPVVISVAYGRGELRGAPMSSTPGHLMVIRGFRSDGAVIVNDPAASSNAGVRRVYNRAQLERAWLRGSGGIVYLTKRPSQAWPYTSPRW